MMRRFRQFLSLGSLLATSEGRRAYRTWRPFSLTAYRMLSRLRNETVTFGTIIDGGANIGQFSRAAIASYPDAQLLAFEPLPDVAAKLRANLQDVDGLRIFETALGSETGQLVFHRNAYTLSSSALSLHKNHRDAFPEATRTQTISVGVTTLDDVLADIDLPGPVLLKLDLQGYEMAALKGAAETLTRIDCILLETAFRPLYEGEALFPEIHDFLTAQGFRFLRPLDTLEAPDGTIIQMDALFARPGI